MPQQARFGTSLRRRCGLERRRPENHSPVNCSPHSISSRFDLSAVILFPPQRPPCSNFELGTREGGCINENWRLAAKLERYGRDMLSRGFSNDPPTIGVPGIENVVPL